MTNDIVTYTPTPLAEIERMADYAVRSQMFGKMTKEQATVLMMLSQAEGAHPMIAARDFDIIQNKPAKKAEAMLRDFLRAGGSVEWHTLDDIKADATFSHPQGGSYRCVWDMDRAKKAGLGDKENWTKWRRQMLRSRCVSEGCKTVYPAATSGMYTTEEVRDMEPMRDVTPADKPKRTTTDPLAGQVVPMAEVAAAVVGIPPEPAPKVRAPSPAPLSLPFINGAVTKECTSRPQFLALMEAVLMSGTDADDLLTMWDANASVMGDIQAKAAEWLQAAKPKDKADAQAMFDRCAAVYDTIHALMKSAVGEIS